MKPNFSDMHVYIKRSESLFSFDFYYEQQDRNIYKKNKNKA